MAASHYKYEHKYKSELNLTFMSLCALFMALFGPGSKECFIRKETKMAK